MASILDFLNTPTGDELIDKTSEFTSESRDNVISVLSLAFPITLGAIKKNLKLNDGEKILNETLSEEQYNEKFLEHLNEQDPAALKARGSKFLDNFLGADQESVFKVVANITQITTSSVSTIFSMAAPVLISILSIQKNKENIDPSGIETLIDSVLGSSSKFDPSLIQTMIENSSEANIIDEAGGMILGGGKKGEKDGGILGGMHGGK